MDSVSGEKQIASAAPTDKTNEIAAPISNAEVSTETSNAINADDKIHSEVYECDASWEVFSSESNLVTYLASHNRNNEENVNICWQQTTEKIGSDENYADTPNCIENTDKFINSYKVDAQTKTYKCFVCHQHFNARSHSSIHIKTCTGETLFECFVCDQHFAQSNNIERQTTTNTEDKRFKCSICDHSCDKSSHLITHMRTHSEEKPFKCSVCDKSYKYSKDLIRHLRTHTGEKPYKCLFCDQRFKRSHENKVHMKTHT